MCVCISLVIAFNHSCLSLPRGSLAERNFLNSCSDEDVISKGDS